MYIKGLGVSEREKSHGSWGGYEAGLNDKARGFWGGVNPFPLAWGCILRSALSAMAHGTRAGGFVPQALAPPFLGGWGVQSDETLAYAVCEIGTRTRCPNPVPESGSRIHQPTGLLGPNIIRSGLQGLAHT